MATQASRPGCSPADRSQDGPPRALRKPETGHGGARNATIGSPGESHSLARRHDVAHLPNGGEPAAQILRCVGPSGAVVVMRPCRERARLEFCGDIFLFRPVDSASSAIPLIQRLKIDEEVFPSFRSIAAGSSAKCRPRSPEEWGPMVLVMHSGKKRVFCDGSGDSVEMLQVLTSNIESKESDLS